jgi:short-subunit dehydrogenase
MTDLTGKAIWITGASSGIGEALAVAASRRGARLILSARREGELERVRGLCARSQDVALLPLDLTSFDATAAAAAAARPFGQVEMLVNNAGISQRGLVVDTDMAVYRRIMELDFFAVVALTKAVLPSMMQKGAGHIVTISSVVGKVATPLRSGYSAAKHALHGFHDALRAEVHESGVKVSVVCPGFVRTQVSNNALTGSGIPQGKMDDALAAGMDPQLCAERIWQGVVKDQSEIVVGGRETYAMLLKRLSPGLLEKLIRKVKVT